MVRKNLISKTIFVFLSIILTLLLCSCTGNKPINTEKPESTEQTTDTLQGSTINTDEPVIKTYTVIFADYDGAVLKEERVETGGEATAPRNPTRNGYEFIGWDKQYNCVTDDLTITAMYSKIDVPTIYIENVYVSPGQNAEVKIFLENNPGIAAAILSVVYDHKIVKPTEVIFEGEYKNGGEEPNLNKNPIDIVWSDINELDDDGEFVTIKFETSSDAPIGYESDVEILYRNSDIIDIDENEIVFKIINGKIIFK